MSHKPCVVVGAGIAGASVAYFLAQQGVQVTVLDAGNHTASHVPAALLNPVRGQSGRVEADALAGLALTWHLIDQLSAQGHHIPHGKTGLLRPVPDEPTRARFERHLPPELEYEWRKAAAPLAPGWTQALWLPQGGWVEGQALCQALLAASGAEVRRTHINMAWDGDSSEAQAIVALGHPPTTPTRDQFPTGTRFFMCGGSVGSSLLGERRTHRMGSVLLLEQAPTRLPLSFGVYLTPAAQGGLLGGTFEAPTQQWQIPQLPLKSLHWLLQKGEALTQLGGLQVRGRWTGSRLSGLKFGPDEQGIYHLSGLGSKGFLLGPLYAQRLVESL